MSDFLFFLPFQSLDPVEVEAVYGQLKKNKMFNRCRMKGIKNVETEFGLLAMVHNLLKMMKNRAKTLFFVFIQKKEPSDRKLY